MAARARTWRLKFLRAVIAAFHALSDGSPATSPEAIGLRQRPETLVPLPPMGDRAGDGRGRFGVGHAVRHHPGACGLRQHGWYTAECNWPKPESPTAEPIPALPQGLQDRHFSLSPASETEDGFADGTLNPGDVTCQAYRVTRGGR